MRAEESAEKSETSRKNVPWLVGDLSLTFYSTVLYIATDVCLSARLSVCRASGIVGAYVLYGNEQS